MPNEGQPALGTDFTIRVFYPNPLPYSSTAQGPLDFISKEYKVSYLIDLDPVYHKCVFIDDKGIRHNFMGMAYHVTEKVPAAGGIDAQV